MTAVEFEKFIAILATSEHEAAHAVMRRIVGLEATALWATEAEGSCDGTGKLAEPSRILLVLLAGMANECACGIHTPDFEKSVGSDFDEARAIVEACDFLRIVESTEPPGARLLSVNDALLRHYRLACDLLRARQDEVEALAQTLAERGHLPASEVAEVLDWFDWPCQPVSRPARSAPRTGACDEYDNSI